MDNKDNNLSAPQPLDDYEVDQTTGFISYKRFDAFDAPKKVIFLTHYRKTLNMTKASELCGTNRMTVMYHFERDRAFAKAVMQAKLGVADELVGKAREVALKDEGVRDRWSLIEKLNPDEYGRKEQAQNQQINITIDSQALEKAKLKQEAIDAEIVQEAVNKDLPPTLT